MSATGAGRVFVRADPPDIAQGARCKSAYELIIVDEVGYLHIEQNAANPFFQLVSSRYEHA